MTHHPWSKLQSALNRIIDPEVVFLMVCPFRLDNLKKLKNPFD